MTAQNGALVLIQVGDGGGPEVFTTVGGLRATDMAINSKLMETSNIASGAWMQLLPNAGKMSFHISGSGLFTDSAAEELVRLHAFAGSVSNYRFVFANGSCVTGPFMISSYLRSANYDAEEHFALAMDSAGNVTYTPG